MVRVAIYCRRISFHLDLSLHLLSSPYVSFVSKFWPYYRHLKSFNVSLFFFTSEPDVHFGATSVSLRAQTEPQDVSKTCPRRVIFTQPSWYSNSMHRQNILVHTLLTTGMLPNIPFISECRHASTGRCPRGDGSTLMRVFIMVASWEGCT